MSGAENSSLDTNVLVYAFDNSEAVKCPAAQALIELCHTHGVACWVGTMPELGVGQAQGIHLAALANCKYPTDVEPSARWFVDDYVVPRIEMVGGPSRLLISLVCRQEHRECPSWSRSSAARASPIPIKSLPRPDAPSGRISAGSRCSWSSRREGIPPTS